MEFDTGRLEPLSRIGGYSSEGTRREPKRRPRRASEECLELEDTTTPPQDDDCHQVDDVI